ncbi:MCE family protein [Nocardioides marmoriginsengisoli]|uniref:MCE family protein n=1 Tax=Nocardioides marmoriginsengisoli TaxID=661483 RepID=A0A3N0CPK6_9ACTN|nr:MCE family protein [Nocardioides marmoriginsengisoli]RNL64823.1 MCE family protein [Nocardioides marmoriginsengisoli]
MKKLTSLALLLAMLFGFSGCTPVGGGGSIKITALMSDSAGLFVGNDVGILGVTVGKVTAIEPDGTRVRVVMKIDADQAVPADAGAVVVARSVATDRYVELTPVFHGGKKMADGAVIEQSQTRTPVDFDDVLGALNTFATGIAGTKETRNAIRNILKSGSEALDGKGEDFNRAVTALGAAVDSISGQRGNITGTVKSLDTLTGTIAENQELVRTFITQVSKASDLLADERANFQSSLRSLSSAVALVADFAHTNRQQLTTTLSRSTDLLKSLLTKRDRLTEILRVMPLTLQNLKGLYHDGSLRVRLDPLVITPIGGLVNTLCNSLPTDICAAFGPSLLNLQNLLQLLGVGK